MGWSYFQDVKVIHVEENVELESGEALTRTDEHHLRMFERKVLRKTLDLSLIHI